MKSLFILGLLCFGLASAQSGMQNLCPNDVFTYSNVLVNSVYLLNLNFTLDPIGTYSINEFVNFYDPTLGLSDSYARGLENIKREHNENLLSLYSQKFFYENLSEKNYIYKKILAMKERLKFYYSNTESGSKAEAEVIRATNAVKKTIKLFDYLNELSMPYLRQKVLSILELTNAIRQMNVDPKTHHFVFSGKPISSLYTSDKELLKRKRFSFTGNQGMLIDWKAAGVLTKTLFLPFENLRFNETDNSNCIPLLELPMFFKSNRDSPNTDYPTDPTGTEPNTNYPTDPTVQEPKYPTDPTVKEPKYPTDPTGTEPYDDFPYTTPHY